MIPSQGIRFWVDGFFIPDNEFEIPLAFRICLKKFAKREQKRVRGGHTTRNKNLPENVCINF